MSAFLQRAGHRDRVNLSKKALPALCLILCLYLFYFCEDAGNWGSRLDALPVFGQYFHSSLEASHSNSAPSDAIARAVVQLLAIGPEAGLNNRECGGTGFLIDEQGYILTNAHVIEQAQSCLPAVPGAKLLARVSAPGTIAPNAVSCDIVGSDEVHDLAVLRPERPLPTGPEGEPVPFLSLDLAEIKIGTPVAVVGHPLFSWNPVTQAGRVIRHEWARLSETSGETTEVLILDIPLRPGNSGSPVYLLGEAAVVGIIERQDLLNHSDTVAVSARHAAPLLNRLGVKWSKARK